MRQQLEVHDQIWAKVQEFDHLTFFVHERPDFDALGSAFAFKELINNMFPEKRYMSWGHINLIQN